MVDTHAHIALCEGDPAGVVERAANAGVTRILTVGLDEESNRDAVRLAGNHEAVWASVGRHPNSASGWDSEAEAELQDLASDDRVAAIGETGLDFYRDRASHEEQLAAFRAHIQIARAVSKPLVIHMRSAEDGEPDAVTQSFELLASEASGVEVVLHCFSAPPERIAEAVANRWFCSFAGNVTYPKADGIREAARLVPDDLILVETDSPFLAPQSRRGKPNEPALVVETAREVAAARGVSPAELDKLVEENACRVFGW
ncbi:MAG: TatD family hydrolase [Actinomycetota bacterium]|nr:TatD family hydrolase [Actinomycetota bacterium]